VFELLSYGDAGWGDEILRGLAVTVQLAIVTLPLGLFLGFLIAFASMSKSRLLRS
jgi:polar amino acid transport system permease protein